MDLHGLDEYIQEVTNNEIALSNESLIERIQNYLKVSEEHHSDETKTFFEAEKAFYAKEYEKAYELQKEFSEDERGCFFFFRTAAYYLEEIEDFEQAKFYASKALKVFSGSSPWKSHLTTLAENLNYSLSNDDDIDFISVDPKELDELTDMFQDESEANEIRNILEENLPKEEEPSPEKELPSSPYTPLKESFETLNTPLDKAFFESQNQEIELVNQYLEYEKESRHRPSYIYFFNQKKSEQLSHYTSQESETMGYYFSWNNQGVVINPRLGFLEDFHNSKLALKDIHSIFITSSSIHCLEELKAIHSWNHQLNRLRDEAHYIQYYLPEKLYQAILKEFSFYNREERESVHSLYFFEGSKNHETISFSNSLSCTYYTNHFSGSSDDLGMTFELSHAGEESRTKKTLAFLTHIGWSDNLKSQIKNTDIIVAGMGKTAPHDYLKEKFLNRSLGVHGITEVLNKVNPELLIISEFEKGQEALKWPLYNELLNNTSLVQANILLSSNDTSYDLFSSQMNHMGKLHPLDDMHAIHIDNEVKYVYKQDIL